MAYPLPPKLLSCPQVSAFLHDSLASLQKTRGEQTTTLQTAMLVTPDGKLLTYESPLPVRTLRTYCSVAASLWAIHAASSPSAAIALNGAAAHSSPLPGKRGLVSSESLASLPRAAAAAPASVVVTPPQAAASAAGLDGDQPPHDGSLPVSIAASFGGGAVFVVHRLKCGLFLACSTPAHCRSSSRPGTAGTGASRATESSAVASSTAGIATSSSAHPAQSSLLPQSTLPQQTPPAPTPTPAPAPAQAPAPAPAPAPVPAPHRFDTTSDADTPSEAFASLPLRPKTPKAAASVPHPTAAAAGEDSGREGADGERADGERQKERVLDTGGRDKASLRLQGGSRKESVAATFALVRQQVDELAQQLDEQLSGLEVPTGNIGLNGFC